MTKYESGKNKKFIFKGEYPHEIRDGLKQSEKLQLTDLNGNYFGRTILYTMC